jgi:glycerol uptake facilitator-like aquaporin
MNAKMSARLGAEFIGTFWLVFGGCGRAVIAGRRVRARSLTIRAQWLAAGWASADS